MKFAEQEHPDTVIGPDGEEHEFFYFLWGTRLPVRMFGGKVRGPWGRGPHFSEFLDKTTKEFILNNHHAAKLPYDQEGDAQQVSKEEFYQACDDYIAYWTPEEIERAERNAIAMRRAVEEEGKNG